MGEPMRVLQVLGSSAGGVSRHVAQIAAGTGARDVRVVVAGPSGLASVLSPDDSVPFAPVEITDRPGPGDLRALVALRRLAGGADVVHAHGLRAGALTVLACVGLRRRPAVVVTLHNLPVGGRAVTGVAAVLEQVVSRGATTVLGVSGDLVARARDRGARVTARALVPAPPRPDAAHSREEVRAQLGLRTEQPLLVTVARLAPQKGLDLLCDTAELLAGMSAGDQVADLRWVVAGDGPLEAGLRARVRDGNLPVELLGRREDVPDLLAAADVVVSTARWEGQPLGIQEALALGAAVVATDVGGTGEVTGDAAVLVPTQAEALAQAITALLTDPERMRLLREAARRRAGTLPDLEATLDQLVAVWSEAAHRAGSGPSTH